MLKLMDDKVYLEEQEIGLVQDLNYFGSGFSMSLPDSTIIFIPEEDCTPSEQEVFTAFHEYYKETGGIPPVKPSEPQIINEPVDEEKVALAEAVIFLSTEIDNLKTEINTLKGGTT